MPREAFRCALWQVIGSAKAKDIMAVHCELRRSEKEVVPRLCCVEAHERLNMPATCQQGASLGGCLGFRRVASKSRSWSGASTDS